MKYITYTPMGAGSCNSRYGFNGELKDKASGGYLLGNGTRLYLPGLGGFTSSDSLSPFSGGGLNPYRYCNADPINLSDPSGHMSQTAAGIFGIIGGLIGIAFAIPTGGLSMAAAIGLEVAGIASSVAAIATDDSESDGGNDGLSTGAIVGISVGIAAMLGMGSISLMKKIGYPSRRRQEASPLNATINSHGLIESSSIGKKSTRKVGGMREEIHTLYRLDHDSNAAKSGFSASNNFAAVDKMIDGDALIVAESLSGIEVFRRSQSAQGFLYRIDVTNLRGVSLKYNMKFNDKNLRRHLNISDGVNIKEALIGAHEMKEAHVSLSIINSDSSTITKMDLPTFY